MNEDTFRKLNYIKDTKEEIRTVLNTRGAQVAASTPLSQYPEIIRTFVPVAFNATIDYNNRPQIISNPDDPNESAANITRNIIKLPEGVTDEILDENAFSSNIIWNNYSGEPYYLMAWDLIKVLDLNFPSKKYISKTFRQMKGLEEINSVSPLYISGIFDFTFEGCISLKKVPDIVVYEEYNSTYEYSKYGLYKTFADCKSLSNVNISFDELYTTSKKVYFDFNGTFMNTGNIVPNFDLNSLNLNTAELFSVNYTDTYRGSKIQQLELIKGFRNTKFNGVFCDCTNLTSLIMPMSIYTVDKENPFTNCSSLTSLKVNGTIDYIADNDTFNLSTVPLTEDSMKSLAEALKSRWKANIIFMYKPSETTISILKSKDWRVSYINENR